MSDTLTPVARLVSGHPMVSYPVTDKAGAPKLMATGEPMNSTSVGLAFAKGPETHWNQTPWGAVIWNAGMAAWPNGEYQAPTFAWKVTDGDSPVPNKKGNKPCDQEGWSGHWILFLSTMFSIPSYHLGKYEAHQVIQNKAELKTGDYVRASFNCVGNNVNGPCESPGVYINPVMLELSRAGQLIVSASAPDAAAAFGQSAPVIPTNALVDTAIQAQPAATAQAPALTQQAPPIQQTVVTPTVTPAHDLVQPQTPGANATPPPVITPPPAEQSYNYNGAVYTESTLLAMPGWTPAHLATLPKV